LAATKPHRISVYRVADRDDLEERAKHFTKVHSPERLPDTGIISPGAPDALRWGRIAPAKMPGYRPNTNSIDAVDKFFSSGASGMRLFG
jgi:hypothetical protein